jgi:hypothetical protein
MFEYASYKACKNWFSAAELSEGIFVAGRDESVFALLEDWLEGEVVVEQGEELLGRLRVERVAEDFLEPGLAGLHFFEESSRHFGSDFEIDSDSSEHRGKDWLEHFVLRIAGPL